MCAFSQQLNNNNKKNGHIYIYIDIDVDLKEWRVIYKLKQSLQKS